MAVSLSVRASETECRTSSSGREASCAVDPGALGSAEGDASPDGGRAAGGSEADGSGEGASGADSFVAGSRGGAPCVGDAGLEGESAEGACGEEDDSERHCPSADRSRSDGRTDSSTSSSEGSPEPSSGSSVAASAAGASEVLAE